MSQQTLRRTSAALTLATLLALPVAPAAAASARPIPAPASAAAEAWRFLTDLFGLGGGSGSRQGHGLKPIVAKLGGYVDPDGRATTLTSSIHTLVKP